MLLEDGRHRHFKSNDVTHITNHTLGIFAEKHLEEPKSAVALASRRLAQVSR